MRTKKISIILVRMNTDQCVENIIFIVATDDYSNFRYKKLVLGIKMIRQISNLDDEKEGRKK